MNKFDEWNQNKKIIENKKNHPNCFPKTGEVWFSFLGKNIGAEQNGGNNNFSRPVLIVNKFNNQMFWVVPLSTKQKRFDFYYNFKDANDKKISVILAQLKLMSIKRLERKISVVSKGDFDSIRKKLKNFLT
jgi:mRNA interferase MazF